MSDNYQNALNIIKNDRKFLNFIGCCNNRNVNGVTGPTGPLVQPDRKELVYLDQLDQLIPLKV